MTRADLIKIARKCGDRTIDCTADCPFFSSDCMVELVNALADELEQSSIVVGNGKDYEVIVGADNG